VCTSLWFTPSDPFGLGSDGFAALHLCVCVSHSNKDGIYIATYLRLRDLSVRELEFNVLKRAAFFLFLFFTLAFV